VLPILKIRNEKKTAVANCSVVGTGNGPLQILALRKWLDLADFLWLWPLGG
jgi:hypothetical protein